MEEGSLISRLGDEIESLKSQLEGISRKIKKQGDKPYGKVTSPFEREVKNTRCLMKCVLVGNTKILQLKR